MAPRLARQPVGRMPACADQERRRRRWPVRTGRTPVLSGERRTCGHPWSRELAARKGAPV